MYISARQLVCIPSLAMGAIIGSGILGLIQELIMGRNLRFLLSWVGTSLALFLCSTTWIFISERAPAGLTVTQWRMLWTGAFILGAIGMPVIYHLAFA